MRCKLTSAQPGTVAAHAETGSRMAGNLLKLPKMPWWHQRCGVGCDWGNGTVSAMKAKEDQGRHRR